MSVAQKAKRELWEFALLSAYLYVCFGALILYKAAILQGEGISYLPFGLVAIKALILGKFILLGQAIRWGDRRGSHKRANDIAYKALLYLILLIVLSVVEEAVVAIIHGENIGPVLASHVGDKLPKRLQRA